MRTCIDRRHPHTTVKSRTSCGFIATPNQGVLCNLYHRSNFQFIQYNKIQLLQILTVKRFWLKDCIVDEGWVISHLKSN